jgi:hypothetical protein
MNHLSSCGRFLFVSFPTLRGLWMKTDACVQFVPCSTCRARKGEPCSGKQGRWHTATHVQRRKAYTTLLRAKTSKNEEATTTMSVKR